MVTEQEQERQFEANEERVAQWRYGFIVTSYVSLVLAGVAEMWSWTAHTKGWYLVIAGLSKLVDVYLGAG